MKKDKIPKVLFRYEKGFEHIMIHQDGIVISDECEGFPAVTGREVLECLAVHGIIELEKEEISD